MRTNGWQLAVVGTNMHAGHSWDSSHCMKQRCLRRCFSQPAAVSLLSWPRSMLLLATQASPQAMNKPGCSSSHVWLTAGCAAEGLGSKCRVIGQLHQPAPLHRPPPAKHCFSNWTLTACTAPKTNIGELPHRHKVAYDSLETPLATPCR